MEESQPASTVCSDGTQESETDHIGRKLPWTPKDGEARWPSQGGRGKGPAHP